jgi:hypothetical protein
MSHPALELLARPLHKRVTMLRTSRTIQREFAVTLHSVIICCPIAVYARVYVTLYCKVDDAWAVDSNPLGINMCSLVTLSALRLSRDNQVHWREKLRKALSKKILIF